MKITQGDAETVLNFTAQNGAGVAHDLTGASFTTYIRGPLGVTVSFANSKHSIVSAAAGTFTLTLTAEDTAQIAVGSNKEIITKVTQGSSVIHFHGRQILDVLPALPVA